MKTVTLSGWGQSAEALSIVAPEAKAIDYAHLESFEAALEYIAEEAADAEKVIGWSLGGFLSVQAIARGLIHPKKLVLIAAPFQFVADDSVPEGMGRQTFATFKANFLANPKRTLAKAHALVALHDTHEARVRHTQERYLAEEANWRRWLEVLEKKSCINIDFSSFCKILLIHGIKDAVISFEQSCYFEKNVPESQKMLLPGAAHAPHWHDPDLVRGAIERF